MSSRVGTSQGHERELGHLHRVAIGKALEACVANEKLRGEGEQVGQASLAEVDPAPQAAVGGMRFELDHAAILCAVGLAAIWQSPGFPPGAAAGATGRASAYDPTSSLMSGDGRSVLIRT